MMLAFVVGDSDFASGLTESFEVRLSVAEQDRLTCISRAYDRAAFVAARIAARMCVAQFLDCDARDISIVQRCHECGGSHGQPYVLDAPWMSVSWSHSGGLAAAAASDRGPVGIDLEVCHGSSDNVVWEALSPDEAKDVQAATEPYKAFVEYWVQKEALIKAGHGSIDSLSLIEPRKHDGLMLTTFRYRYDAIGAYCGPHQVAMRLRGLA